MKQAAPHENLFQASLECSISSLLGLKPIIWQHQLLLSIPEDIKADMAFLYLSSGDHKNADMHPRIKAYKTDSGAVVAQLRIFTNGPVLGMQSHKALSEDHAIALSWMKYLQNQDEALLIQLRLQKVVSQAIDLIEGFLLKKRKVKLKGAVLAGQSKRGHLAWLSASRDQRIAGVIPMVFDLLNLRVNMQHHFKVYGHWAKALAPYEEYGILHRINDVEFAALTQVVDPFCFSDKVKVPKYIINAANDEYFLPDSSQHYFDGLKGPKALCYLPNHGHRLEDCGQAYWDDVFAAFQLISRVFTGP